MFEKRSIKNHFFPILLMVPLMIVGCQTSPAEEENIERPRDPWVIRSVLDQQIRMVTLALHKDNYAAYHTENCALYKVWKGGVHWDGAAFNNVKTVQPESYGMPYLEKQPKKPWQMAIDGKKERISPQFKGYRLQQNRLTFQYEVTLPDGTKASIFEQPEFLPEENGKVGFSRHFSTSGFPENVEVWNGDLALPINGEETFVSYFDALPPVPEALAKRETSSAGSQYWLDRSGCNTCHEMDERTIGPSYHEIAQKYERDDVTTAMLVAKVKNGGAGAWGDVPMQPHPHLKDGDIRRMVRFILSLKPEDEAPKAVQKTSKQPKPEASFANVAKVEEALPKPGFGRSLEDLHPSLRLATIRPEWFQPRVGGMGFLPNGTLLVSTWDSIGAVYTLKNMVAGDTSQIQVERMAAGLSEPLGLKVVDGEVFVLQKHELTQLIDHDGDGITDEYRTISNTFDATPDFHEFSYGLEHQDGYFYANLGLAMRLMSHETQLPDRGTTILIAPDGSYTNLMTGLRQANGLGFGPDGELFITENQGQWVPACKLIHVKKGTYHGCQFMTGDRYEGLEMTPPAVWLPQDEIGNSPGEPVLIDKGIFAGQMLHGEVTHGGLKRVFLEKIGGEYQGAVFRFTQGLEAGINRSVWGPDGALYVGGVGMNGNWGWKGTQYGLQKLVFTDKVAFEMLKIESLPDGFAITFTEPLAAGFGESPSDYHLEQWRYEPTPSYGGPKLDHVTLPVASVALSPDRKKAVLKVPGLKKEHVVYFLLNENLQSQTGQSLWAGEAWYTLNRVDG